MVIRKEKRFGRLNTTPLLDASRSGHWRGEDHGTRPFSGARNVPRLAGPLGYGRFSDRGRRRRRPYRQSCRLAVFFSTPRLLDFSPPSLPTSLDVAHAPDGADGVETRRLVVRVKADVLVRVPEMRFPGEEIFDLERFSRFQTPLRQRQMEPGLMGVEGIEVGDDD